MERELGKGGHRKGLWHMVFVKSLWRELQEHMVAPEAVGHRLLRRTVEHLKERMACREAQLEAQAGDMRDPVTKRVEMALIRYDPQITEMEGTQDEEEQEGDEQRESLMARGRKEIWQT